MGQHFFSVVPARRLPGGQNETIRALLSKEGRLCAVCNWLRQRRWIAIASLTVLFTSLGCGGGQTGPKRYPVTGTVTREGIDVDAGNILFIPKEGGGPAAGAIIKAGKYKFTSQDGVPAGNYKVEIIQEPLRDPDFKGKKNEAPLLPDDRFKGKMPPKGWVKEAEVVEGHTAPIDFEISETDAGETQPGKVQRRGG